jgi:hypothetical protein
LRQYRFIETIWRERDNIIFFFSFFLFELVFPSSCSPVSLLIRQVAGHDLRSLIQISDLRIPDLRFPMMALVDYLGFRVVAESILPVNANTLKYGTSDGVRPHSRCWLLLLLLLL